MSAFINPFNALVLSAAETDEGRAFAAAGFILSATGGGCTAWRRDFGARYVLITSTEGCDHTLAATHADGSGAPDAWIVGLHEDDAEDLPSAECATVADAIAEGLAQGLASAFAEGLRGALPDKVFAKMRRRNASRKYAGPICASHDFIDANEIMHAAFVATVGIDPLDEQTDAEANRLAAIWNRAWHIAKDCFLKA